jgi:hypothetical protein
MRAQVLRDNRPTLMTCAETFLHDPLVDWTSGKRAGGSSAQAGALEAENPQVREGGGGGLRALDAVCLATSLALVFACETQTAKLKVCWQPDSECCKVRQGLDTP